MATLRKIKKIILSDFNTINTIKYNLAILFLTISVLIIPAAVFSNTTTVLSRESGGAGGAPFAEMVAPGGVISKITIRSGKLINSIQLTYLYKTKISSKAFGGTGGASKSFNLSRGEYITEFGGRSGKYVDSIYIKTNRGRTESWGGAGGGRSFRFTGTKNLPIQGVWGRSGSLIDAIGVIKMSKSNKLQECTTQANLSTYKPDPDRIALEGASCDTCDTITDPVNPVFPTINFLTIKDEEFWKDQNNKLSKIIRSLAESPAEFNSYIRGTELEHCSGHIYCEIDTRTDLIFKSVGREL